MRSLDSDKVEIGGIGFAAFLTYILFVWFCECFSLFLYLVGAQPALLTVCTVGALCVVGMLFLLKNHVKCTASGHTLVFFIGCALLLLFGIYKGWRADLNYDTMNYHLIAQKFGFLDAFQTNIAPGSFQFFGFALSDKLYYLFRLLLGYRMGTILTSISACLIYDQAVSIVKDLLKKDSNDQKRTEYMLEAIVFGAVMLEETVKLQGTYLVDLALMPIGLRLFRKVLESKGQNHKDIFFTALLAGLFFAGKLTHIVYVVPLVLYYIWKNRAYMCASVIILSGMIAFAPCSVYLIYNSFETGNPIFPYMNSFFESPYFLQSNFKDVRWGPSNLMEYLLWPFYMVLFPEYRQNEIPPSFMLPSSIGVFFCFGSCIMACIRKWRKRPDNRAIAEASALVCAAYVLWLLSTGILRYFLMGFIVGELTLIVGVFLLRAVWMRTLKLALLGCFTAQAALSFWKVGYEGQEYAWRNFDASAYGREAAWVLQDYFVQPETEIDGFILTQLAESGYAELIDSEAPQYNLAYLNSYMEDSDTKAALKEIVDEQFRRDKQLYTVGVYEKGNIYTKMESLNEQGLRAISVTNVSDSANWAEQQFLLYKLEKMDNGEDKNILYESSSSKQPIRFELKYIAEGKLTFSCGLSHRLGWYEDQMMIARVLVNEKEIGTFPVKDGDYTLQEFPLTEKQTDTVQVTILLETEDGQQLTLDQPYGLIVINPQIKQ